MSDFTELAQCLNRIAQLQRQPFDAVGADQAAAQIDSTDPQQLLEELLKELYLNAPNYLSAPDLLNVPALILDENRQWGVVRGQDASGQWVVNFWSTKKNEWVEEFYQQPSVVFIAQIKFKGSAEKTAGRVLNLIKNEIGKQKKVLLEAVLAGLVINSVGLAVAMYTLLVYDRVIPTSASQTLAVLTLGVAFAIAYEFLTKCVRSRLFEKLIIELDKRLARAVYSKFLAVRLDQLPPSVGSMASQIRGYESVRSFLATATTHILVDIPYSFAFLAIVYLIGGKLVFIPLSFFCLCLLLGFVFKRKVAQLALASNGASNLRTGLLVETVEGAETIKSGQSGWRMLSRWLENTDQARDYEMSTRRINEYSQYLIAMFQQVSYIGLVASGALLVSRGELTMGSLIACSILSGRILTPAAAIPNQLVQWSHVKAALESLDHLWSLEDDHSGHNQPLLLEKVMGQYQFENVVARYGDIAALSVPALRISEGEKVAIVGPAGAGKTTFIRMLSGMYKPDQGRILLGGVDISSVSKPILSEHVAFVPQEGRLFMGTLRENLILGLMDPGDEKILSASLMTGLFDAVVANHPEGLNRPIFEGGAGLSVGQKQLLNLTRAFLRKPSIWLLDEPTSAMDQNLESRIMLALRQSIGADDTLVIATHKTELLDLVDRVIVIAGHLIIMDGPKDKVLRQINSRKPMAASA